MGLAHALRYLLFELGSNLPARLHELRQRPLDPVDIGIGSRA
jgi:hypothetical protein